MNFALQQRDPRRHFVAIGMVALVHVVLVYGLVSGLAKKVVSAFQNPLDVSIVEELRKPDEPPKAPPPKVNVTKVEVPPPSYVPPPEVTIAAPPVAPTVTVTTAVAPPPAPPVVAAEPARPATVSVAVACPNHVEVRSKTPYPSQALRMGISGEVLMEFTLKPNGAITDITVVRSSQSIFNAVASNAVAQLVCTGQSESVKVRVPFVFKLER